MNNTFQELLVFLQTWVSLSYSYNSFMKERDERKLVFINLINDILD